MTAPLDGKPVRLVKLQATQRCLGQTSESSLLKAVRDTTHQEISAQSLGRWQLMEATPDFSEVTD
jgi:hypothetical protein